MRFFASGMVRNVALPLPIAMDAVRMPGTDTEQASREEIERLVEAVNGHARALVLIAREIAEATAFILLVGEKGISPWQAMEYYEALDRRVKQLLRAIDATHQGLWLGLLDRASLHRVTEATYRSMISYQRQSYNLSGLTNWESAVVERFFGDCRCILVGGAGTDAQQALAVEEDTADAQVAAGAVHDR